MNRSAAHEDLPLFLQAAHQQQREALGRTNQVAGSADHLMPATPRKVSKIRAAIPPQTVA
jgi:hypothetical protein